MFDGGNENILSHIFRITNFINDAIKEGGKVLLHCVEGVSRSAAVCIGYLIVTNEIDYKTAYDTVRSKRRISSPNPKFVAQLMQLAEIMGTSKTASCYFSKTKTIPFKVTERNDELVMLPIYSKIPEGDEENAYILLDYSNCKNGLPKNTDNENHAIITQYIGQKAPFEYKDCAQEFIESLKKCLNIEEIESIK
ncbi:Dual specificity phosphatase, catalytic domain containing protein [Histomonas meleagridis]|uniref:Dual specificity phosphatase, catalytic domain containing protein n=1 Tax=Histomonas meleagridis TaxID=135588 RepID=UPI00355AC754|nr:Dual specificity phosphatase, catalytic domain containing protein [Histomonas meleagridis]KAH0797956.1 Dual specificity phosphatase, catalytic domain containing protein [Histomonas meleagridis]